MSTEVEDKGSRIRVTALNTIPIGQKAYVKIAVSYTHLRAHET